MARQGGKQGPRRAAAYVRVSKWEEEGDSSATRRQEPDCRELVARRRWELVGVYKDDDRSAFSGKRRPAYERLIDDVKNGRVDVIVCQHPDRLHRRPVELEHFIDLLELTGCTVASCTAGDIDFATPEGRLMARITGAVARKESEDKSRRLRRMMVELVESGKPNGSPRPFGWESDRVTPRPAEAVIVAEMVARLAAGETLSGVVKDLNGRGVLNGRGNPWTIAGLRIVALNGRNAGIRMHNGVEAGPADWPAIVDEALWRRARALLNAPERRQRRTARRYLLSGSILRCGKCGGAMRSKHMRASTPAYACEPSTKGGCGGVTVLAEPVEGLVTDAVMAAVSSTRFAKAMRRRQVGTPKVAADLSKIEQQMGQLADAFGAGSITITEWTRARDGLTRRLTEAQTAMTVDTAEAAAGRYAGQAGALAEVWPAMTLDARQAVIRSVVDSVVVSPVGRGGGKRFDPARVSIIWRF